jgi:hypothetical protein
MIISGHTSYCLIQFLAPPLPLVSHNLIAVNLVFLGIQQDCRESLHLVHRRTRRLTDTPHRMITLVPSSAPGLRSLLQNTSSVVSLYGAYGSCQRISISGLPSRRAPRQDAPGSAGAVIVASRFRAVQFILQGLFVIVTISRWP